MIEQRTHARSDEVIAAAEEARHREVLALESGTQGAVGRLISALGDPSWRVRKTGVMQISRFSEDTLLIPALVAALSDPENAGLRNSCAEALVRLRTRSIGELARVHRKADADARKFIIEILGRIGTIDAQDVLYEALDDADENVRSVVIEGLGQIGGDQAVKILLEQLVKAGGDILQTVYILNALVDADAVLSFDELAPFIGKSFAARPLSILLGYCNDVRAFSALLEGLDKGAKKSRHAALRGLAMAVEEYADDAEIEQLRSLFQINAEVLEAVRESLFNDDDEVAIASIVVCGAYADSVMAPDILRAAACREFVEDGVDAVVAMGASVVPSLFARIEKVDIESRVLYLQVIEELADDQIVSDLLDIARGPDDRSVEAALKAVGTLANRSHITLLMDVTESLSPDLSVHGALALGELSERFPDEVRAEILKAIRRGVQEAAWLEPLARLASPDDAALVASLMHHSNPQVRRAAVSAAGFYHDNLEKNQLILALSDEDPVVRANAARSLSFYPPGSELSAALFAATSDFDVRVVQSAITALGQVGGEEAFGSLKEAAQSTISPVAIAALRALLNASVPDVLDIIRRCLAHADPEVGREALALSALLSDSVVLNLLEEALSHRSWTVRAAASQILYERGLPINRTILQERLALEDEELVRAWLERLVLRWSRML